MDKRGRGGQHADILFHLPSRCRRRKDRAMRKSNREGWAKTHTLKIHRETLRRLTQAELERAGGGISGPSLCPETTEQCCVTR
jgi:hypothetical protein